jgi:integrase
VAIKHYRAKGRNLWRFDTEVVDREGHSRRIRQRAIPTKEQAEALEAKHRSAAFEGRFFDRREAPNYIVEALWQAWEPTTRQKNDSWRTDIGRAAHLVRHLGQRLAVDLTPEVVTWYRGRRLKETTKRGKPPRPATLNREVALLRRVLEYAVECRKLDRNPISGVSMLKENNVRRVLVSEVEFSNLLQCADPDFRAILLVAYDTGMRLSEVLQLRRAWLDLASRRLILPEEFTKGEESRPIRLTRRTVEALKALPVQLDAPFVFVNPETKTCWKNTRRMWKRASEAAGLEAVWFHDLRRSFVTNARRRGVSERVTMKMSGHRTRSIFDRYNIVEERDIEEAADTIERGAEAELAVAAAKGSEPTEGGGKAG